MATEAVIFDFDGTIADTGQLVMDSWQHTFRTVTGAPGDPKAIYRTFGETLRESMSYMFPDQDVDYVAGIYRDYQLMQGDENWTAFAGMPELIRELHGRGISLGVVTSRTGDSLRRGLEIMGLLDAFDTLISCDDTDAHKPEPEPALIGLERLNVQADRALFVGDTVFDIGCAHNAGIQAVLVGWNVSVEPEDKKGIFHPDYEIAEPGELLALID